MHALEEARAIFTISVLELILNIVLSCLLIPTWGLEGVAFATVLAYLFEKVAMMIFLLLKHQIAPSAYLDWPWLSFYLVGLLAAWWGSCYLV